MSIDILNPRRIVTISNSIIHIKNSSADIATNTADIATNAANIAINADAISLLLAYIAFDGNVLKPSGFTYSPPFNIVKSGSTFFPYQNGQIWDISQYFVEGAGVYYVDVNTGNDANPGTEASPLESIDAAINKVDATTVYIAPGHYDRVIGGVSGSDYTKSINLVKNGSSWEKVFISRRQSGLSWSLDGTYTNCYTTTRSSTYKVLDYSSTDADDDILEYTLAASEADCNSTAGSWFIDGANKVYVHTFDARAVDDDIWVLLGENILRFLGDLTLYCEGLTIIGGGGGGIWQRSSAVSQSPKLYAKDCSFLFAGTNGVTALGVSLSIMQNCRASKNVADGFNYHGQHSIVPIAIEVNCVGFKNGIDTNDNGSTGHDASSIVRLNGVYNGNTGPNVVDVGASESWNLGCVANDGVDRGFYIDGNMWIDSCEALGNGANDIEASTGAYLRHKDSQFDTSGGSGTIESY